MKILALTGLLALTATAHATDRALILNDDEQAALRQILDAATRAQGIQIAPVTVYLLNKLNSAPAVVEHKDEPPKPKEQSE